MKPSTAAFFDELGRRGHEPLLERVRATVRFDIGDGASVAHRVLHVDRGDLRVTSEDGEVTADCVVILGEELFDEIVGGRTGAMAAFLRGALIVEGDPEVLVLVQRLFPGHPRGTAHPPRVTSAEAADLGEVDRASADTAGREASGTGGAPS